MNSDDRAAFIREYNREINEYTIDQLHNSLAEVTREFEEIDSIDRTDRTAEDRADHARLLIQMVQLGLRIRHLENPSAVGMKKMRSRKNRRRLGKRSRRHRRR